MRSVARTHILDLEGVVGAVEHATVLHDGQALPQLTVLVLQVHDHRVQELNLTKYKWTLHW